MNEPTNNTCPFCDKKGLPILPLRTAVARSDFNGKYAPLPLPSAFQPGVADVALPPALARYTSRLLRGGYLYVFNEKRGDWRAYLVTTAGYLYEFDIHDTTPPNAGEIEFACSRTADAYIARCITVPDAESAGRVWFGFSDTAWTATVLKRHKQQSYRKQHMRSVDVGAWVGGNASQPHTAPFEQLAAVVNEFAKKGYVPKFSLDVLATESRVGKSGQILSTTSELEEVTLYGYPAFGYSPHRFNGLAHEAQGLVDWATVTAQPRKAMLFDVADPVGITMELAALMHDRLEGFLEQEDLQRPLAISALLDSLQEAKRNQAELGEISSREQTAVRGLEYWRDIPSRTEDGIVDPNRTRMESEHNRGMSSDSAYRREWEQKVKAAKQSAADSLTQDDLDKVADKAWNKYSEQLQPGEPDGWRKRVYQPRLEIFDRETMLPLAKAHRAWLTGDAVAGSFLCNHDNADAESGAGYVQALLLCIQDTQQNQICFDVYQDWLTANTSDPRNLLQRALFHNQQEVVDALDKAVSIQGLQKHQPPSVPWKSLINLYAKSLKHLDAGGENIVAQLLTAVGGPVIKVLNGMIDHTAGRLVIALGVIGRAPITMLTHTGTVDQALEAMVGMMKQVNPKALGNVDAGLLKRRLEIQSRGLRQTVQTRGASGRFGATKVTLRVDRFAVAQLKAGQLPGDIAEEAASAVLRMDEWPKNDMARFRTMFSTNARLAVIGLILQVVSAKSMATKLDGSMSHRRIENSWRFRSSVPAIMGSVGSLLHEIITFGGKAGGIRLAALAENVWVIRLAKLSRGLGVVAAGIVAVCDFNNFMSERGKGNYGMAALYLVSSITGVGAALAFSGLLGATILGLSATGIGLILVAIGIAIALLIEFFKTDELQEWLERSLFGALEQDKRYADLEEEMKQFGLAMNAMGFKSEKQQSPAIAVPAR